MEKRTRGERGGKLALRKKRRESFWNLFPNFLAYFAYYSRPQYTWYSHQVKVVPKPRRRTIVSREHIELPVRNTVSFRGPPAPEETTEEIGSQYFAHKVEAEPVDRTRLQRGGTFTLRKSRLLLSRKVVGKLEDLQNRRKLPKRPGKSPS